MKGCMSYDKVTLILYHKAIIIETVKVRGLALRLC